jgi:hypothetical protein
VIAIERRGKEWAVLHGEQIVSLHPSRTEAERAALWLQARYEDSATPDIGSRDDDCRPQAC